MTNELVHGYVAEAVGKQLTPIEYAPPTLNPQEVRVAITHCGLCHTDIHAIDDYYGITEFPLVPGHEIAGFVSEIGSEVTTLKEGDRVGIGWQGRGCMKCEWCLQGQEQLCMDVVKNAIMTPYGGFASSVVADNRFAYPLPAKMPSPVAAVLMCAGVTVFSALKAMADQPRQRIGILGIGGLGHLAIQFAHAMGHAVTVLSSTAAKQAEALAFGADRFINVNDRASMRTINYEFDQLICTASGGVDWDTLLMTLRKRGRLVLVGFPDVAFNSTDLVAHELTLSGSFLGNRATMAEMLTFADEHGIRPVIEMLPMAQVNEAIQRVRDNQARYRIVLANEAGIAMT